MKYYFKWGFGGQSKVGAPPPPHTPYTIWHSCLPHFGQMEIFTTTLPPHLPHEKTWSNAILSWTKSGEILEKNFSKSLRTMTY